MDSCNSGSLQSSSGGDEEYDSRATVDSVFIHPPPPQQPPLPPVLEPLSNFIQLHPNPNPSQILNPNIPWPGTTLPRSDSNSTFMPSSAAVATVVQNTNPTAARNPKKRSRASRRAPTTVLTTDTTNFRAMVQEFTGIPSPPFNSSSLTRTRFDILGTRSAAVDTPPYLRRTFPQKVPSPPPPPHPFLASSSTQTSNIYNLPNPLLTTLLQTNPKFLFSKPSFDNIPSNDTKIVGLEEYDLSCSQGNRVITTTLNGLPNLISSDQIADIANDNNVRNYEAQLGSVNGGYNLPRNSKTNYSATSSDFNGQKSQENIARGEGMMESWICSSE
ncbi:hypothetical protein CDL12_08393 [Handroanthus impetiginosus]|uniref:VQ domain-containing protein n=1 Tax=Handroanthus impetiginosus TaxID=429701 RepID=A0A2G9HN38_9LAMI|nr:hypothetical protein CDL12_08393 [Handroanthus impetiginosus]